MVPCHHGSVIHEVLNTGVGSVRLGKAVLAQLHVTRAQPCSGRLFQEQQLSRESFLFPRTPLDFHRIFAKQQLKPQKPKLAFFLQSHKPIFKLLPPPFDSMSISDRKREKHFFFLTKFHAEDLAKIFLDQASLKRYQ